MLPVLVFLQNYSCLEKSVEVAADTLSLGPVGVPGNMLKPRE